MSRPTVVKTTIPPRTYGQGRKSNSPHALLLRMSYLELERQRCIQEAGQLRERALKLNNRIEEIEREAAILRETVEAKVKPLSLGGTRAVLSGLSSAGKGRNGLAIRY